jgi:hypothetical protein
LRNQQQGVPGAPRRLRKNGTVSEAPRCSGRDSGGRGGRLGNRLGIFGERRGVLCWLAAVLASKRILQMIGKVRTVLEKCGKVEGFRV